MSVYVESNLAQFNAAFSRYAAIWTKGSNRDGSPRLLDDAIEKKGRDIGIKLYQGFAARKWGGIGKHPGLARAELDARAASGQGIRLRASLMQEYLAERDATRERLKGKRGLNAVKAKVKLWQEFVKKELTLRQSGIGFLAVSFLWAKKGSNLDERIRSKSGQQIGAVERGEGSFRILGDAAGSAEVATRYGIVAAALENATADIETYLTKKDAEAQAQEFPA